MASVKVQARHVFHTGSTGMDRISAWREYTGEPAFVWGRKSGDATGSFFAAIRRLFWQWESATAELCTVTVYHDAPSADALAMLDTAPQKVIHVHDWYPQWERCFDWAIRCTGKALVGETAQVESLRGKFGWIPERFIQVVHEPLLTGMTGRQPDAAGPKQRTGIWLHGKSWRPYGNRLRSIVDRWPDDGSELEILADGPSQPAWSKKPHVVWSSGLPLEFALQRLFTWDSSLLVDNYSLNAPWLMRAIALDVFPLVPDGDNPAFGDAWQRESAPQPYAWGDIPDALRILKEWRSGREHLLPVFRKWGQSLLEERLAVEPFRESWLLAKEQFAGQRIPNLRKRRAYPPWYPLAWFERLHRLRAGY